MKRPLYTFIPLAILAFFTHCDTDQPATQTETADGAASAQDTLVEAGAMIEQLTERIIEAPGNKELYIERGLLHKEAANYEAAMNDFDRALVIDSTFSDAYYQRGNLHFRDQQFDKALADYQRCVAETPNHTDCLMRLGEMHVHLRNYKQAIETINEALRVDGQLPQAYYLKGRVYKETGDTVLAASSYQTAIEVEPDFYDAYIEVGLLYASAGSDLAIEYYKTATEIRPGSIEAWYNLAIFLQSTGFRDRSRYREALNIYDRISGLSPDNATAPYNKGFIHLEYLQHYDSAALYFTEATELFPGYYQAHYNRGLALESLGKAEKALSAYNNALKIQPDYTPAAIAKGRVLGE